MKIKAIYTVRGDGVAAPTYGFVAAFPLEEGCGEDVAEAYATNLRQEGEEVLVKEFDDVSLLAEVLKLTK